MTFGQTTDHLHFRMKRFFAKETWLWEPSLWDGLKIPRKV